MTRPNFSTKGDDGVRWYTLPDGVQLPSVTSILKIINKEQLVAWAARRGVEATVAWFEVETANAYKLGEPALMPTLSARAGLADEHTRVSDRSAALGDQVHAAVEQRILGRTNAETGYHKAIAGHMRMFENFLDTCRPTWEAAEETVVDRGRGWVGTLDARAVIDGKRIVLDLKTGNAVRDTTSLQLAGYRYSPKRLVNGVEVDAPESDGGYVLRLRPRSWQLVEMDTSPLALRGLQFAHGLWSWNQNVAPGAVGATLYRND